jgi:glycosyltransferase involved in cell wall biosynthesis
VVHTHSGVWPKAAAAARAAGVPAIVHTEHGFNYGEPWFSTPLRWWAARSTDLVVAVSAPMRRYLVEHAHIPARRVHTVINGVDAKRFAPGPRGSVRRSWGIPLGAVLVGCVARFDPVKNHALLIDAFATVIGAVPDAYLVLVGDGKLGAELRAQVGKLGLARRVIFAGNYVDTAPVYRDLDLFVLPSVSEGTSISLLEAMASGVPVVATAVGGTPDLLAPGGSECGVLVPSGNREALSDAIVRVVLQPELAASLSRAARERVLAAFDQETMVERYEALYRTVLGRRTSFSRAG